MMQYFDNQETMSGVNWPDIPVYESGCGPDEKTFFSGNVYRPICVSRSVSDVDISRNYRFYEDQYIARIGGLGSWTASTAPVIVSGGGDPQYHGQYDYAGHFWGVPFYRNGDHYVLFSGTWQLVDANLAYPVYSGSGAAPYPWETSGWISAFGTVTNVPTFTRGSGGGSVAIPRWPVLDPPPPGALPWQSGWYQQDYVYQPNAGYAAWSNPYNSDPIPQYGGGIPGRVIYDEYGNPIAATNAMGGGYSDMRPAPGSPGYVDTVDIYGNAVTDEVNPVLQTLGTAMHTLEGTISDAIGGNGTIFGFSPLMVIGLGIGALWLFGGKK